MNGFKLGSFERRGLDNGRRRRRTGNVEKAPRVPLVEWLGVVRVARWEWRLDPKRGKRRTGNDVGWTCLPKGPSQGSFF